MLNPSPTHINKSEKRRAIFFGKLQRGTRFPSQKKKVRKLRSKGRCLLLFPFLFLHFVSKYPGIFCRHITTSTASAKRGNHPKNRWIFVKIKIFLQILPTKIFFIIIFWFCFSVQKVKRVQACRKQEEDEIVPLPPPFPDFFLFLFPRPFLRTGFMGKRYPSFGKWLKQHYSTCKKTSNVFLKKLISNGFKNCRVCWI